MNMRTDPLPAGFATAVCKLHASLSVQVPDLIAISYLLHYRGYSEDADSIANYVTDMRSTIDELSTKLAAVEATLKPADQAADCIRESEMEDA